VNLRTRVPTEADWPAIHAVANEALPTAPDGNEGWIRARRDFDAGNARRHYLVEDGAGDVVVYGAVEASGAPGWFRLFLVTHPDRLSRSGEELLGVLLEDARALNGRVVWLREHADDPLVAFATARGFTEARRYVLGAEHGASSGVEVVELERRL